MLFLRPFAFVLLLGVMGAFYEVILQVADVAEVDAPQDEQVALHRHDAELGWLPRSEPVVFEGADGPLEARPNTFGLRGAEPDPSRPYRILVMGGEHVWGAGVADAERFTDQLAARTPHWDVVNAGVKGYGTDQSLLLARHLVLALRPSAVLLVFDPMKDRDANQANVSPDGHYKPHFVLDDTTLVLRGQPVPEAVAFREDDLPDSQLTRLVADAATRLRHPAYIGPDPSEELLVRFREEVGRVGVSFFVALTRPDVRAEQALDAAGIAWAHVDAYEGPDYTGWHWTPEGHTVVANRLDGFLTAYLTDWSE